MDKSKSVIGKLTTLRSQHEETLEELQRYKVLVNSVQDYAIFFMDKDGYIQTWNKGAQNNKGYTADEIIGQHFSIFYPEKDKKNNKPARQLEIACRDGRVEDEGWRLRKDGSKFWANVVVTALYDKEGELIGFAKVTRNLTERKKQEDKLRKANAELIKQQAELRSLSASKDEFISLASHQLRTPATAVKQLLGILVEGIMGEVPKSQLDLIKKAYDSNERQLAIVNSLLNVAQIDSGKVVIHKEWVEVNALLREVIDEQKESIMGRKQTVTFSALNPPQEIFVDPQYISMAMGNMLDNASKYSHDKAKIVVSVEHNGDYVKIAIHDEGIGIAENDIKGLFEKFKRISNEFSQTSSGSGLGLYWVEKVIELHKGKIEVESTVGKGTTFFITLPIGSEDD